MRVEIITIGDELLIGQVVDTNSAWLGRELNAIGAYVVRITSVCDSREAITGAFDAALSDADLVLVTGGLGPTKDDITKHTLADYFGMPLTLHEPTCRMIERLFANRGQKFNELNRSQADVPAGCRVLPNPNGTAPGMWFERGGKVLVSMPGVPFEMKPMFSDSVVPLVCEHFTLRSVVHRTMLTFGLPESMLADTISEWEAALPGELKLAYLPNPGGIRLRLSAYDTDRESAKTEMERQFDTLRTIIPDCLVGLEPTSLEAVVATALNTRKETLAVAESCTGGAIAARFTAMSGSSNCFLGGIVAYNNDIKHNVLGVAPDDLTKYGAVSQPVVEQMAAGVLRLTGSTYALATSGIAGPTGGGEEKPVGTVWIALAGPQGILSRQMHFGQQREQNIQRATANAINLLRLHLDETR
ncbi:MAG: competence/damage-inducible protein A [Rikenellaceae bacterium]|jgi:nicotinamide-nucleotide amidase|nr:competence/damage-inducible protein A [Rikenellaceae bacterium]